MTTTQIHDTKKSAKKATTSQDDLTDRVETIREQIERLQTELISIRHEAHFGDIVSGAWGTTSQIVLLHTVRWGMNDFIVFRDWSACQRTDYLRDIKQANEQTETPTEYQRSTNEWATCRCEYVCTCLHGYERAEG